MKLLTTTDETHGQRINDFYNTEEGEIAYFGSQCSRARANDTCGCARSMVGIKSRRARTTLRVRAVDMTLDDLVACLTSIFELCGSILRRRKRRPPKRLRR